MIRLCLAIALSAVLLACANPDAANRPTVSGTSTELDAAMEAELKSTPDGRFGTRCASLPVRTGWQPICQVPMWRLVADPERYQGRDVLLIGLLAGHRSGPGSTMWFLFPDRASFEHDEALASLELTGDLELGLAPPDDPAIDQWLLIEPVVVVGRFDHRRHGSRSPSVGELGTLRVLRPVLRLVSMSKKGSTSVVEAADQPESASQ